MRLLWEVLMRKSVKKVCCWGVATRTRRGPARWCPTAKAISERWSG